MPSKLPSIEMPPPQPEVAEPLEPTVPKVDMIDNILEELGDKDMPEDDNTEGEIVPVEPRPKLSEEEVFKDAEDRSNPTQTKEKKVTIVQEDSVMNSETGEVPEKKGRRKYQRKGEMTEKQKAHLEKIRAKALENKKKRREEKEALEKEKKQALEEKREKKRLEDEQKKQEQEVERQAKEAEKLASAMTANMYSKEDLENAMINAIHTYDTHRKEQKAIKRKKQAEEAQKAQQTRLIQQAINPQPPADPWRRYFT